MGIEVSVTYRDEVALEPVIELAREVEAALTTWEGDSPLNRLNKFGYLENPSKHLLQCFEKSRELFQASEGLFDPTIRAYLEGLKTWIKEGQSFTEQEAGELRKLVDFERVDFSKKRVSLPKGMALDFNALAQGYLTDLIAEVLEPHDALVNFGEFRVSGNQSWPVEVGGKTVHLSDALAVSSGGGHRLSATSGVNHLIDPFSGKSPEAHQVFAIEADEAWLADGLATLTALGGGIPKVYQQRARRVL